MKAIVELVRLYTNQKHGTLGILKINKAPFCATLEPSDRLNEIGESSIPTGQYDCVPYSSNKFRNVYEVTKVPGRTNILFHPGNTEKDTAGCILLGSHFNKLASEIRAVKNSGDTFKQFRDVLFDQDFHLTITECY